MEGGRAGEGERGGESGEIAPRSLHSSRIRPCHALPECQQGDRTLTCLVDANSGSYTNGVLIIIITLTLARSSCPSIRVWHILPAALPRPLSKTCKGAAPLRLPRPLLQDRKDQTVRPGAHSQKHESNQIPDGGGVVCRTRHQLILARRQTRHRRCVSAQELLRLCLACTISEQDTNKRPQRSCPRRATKLC